jgi:hypothetical protein
MGQFDSEGFLFSVTEQAEDWKRDRTLAGRSNASGGPFVITGAILELIRSKEVLGFPST